MGDHPQKIRKISLWKFAVFFVCLSPMYACWGTPQTPEILPAKFLIRGLWPSRLRPLLEGLKNSHDKEKIMQSYSELWGNDILPPLIEAGVSFNRTNFGLVVFSLFADWRLLNILRPSKVKSVPKLQDSTLASRVSHGCPVTKPLAQGFALGTRNLSPVKNIFTPNLQNWVKNFIISLPHFVISGAWGFTPNKRCHEPKGP